ncbi:VWA domain-containing protein [Fuchsiella alkaliacetigena]|uniref:VWA domain-containing protein n=1 Tax=Fuchsiella alkaliacetigena TaxID=957042 RepID=UPI00200A435D|nr:VWA domain-containing protein [Fuchsiella alkaliacetigena]MCK8824938.1 VWA domain-containing protein [Fuchsiella alkaliacetigena]
MKSSEKVANQVQKFTDKADENYIERNLIKFIQILRNLGIRISLAESIEALEALQLIEIVNKGEFKTTLRSMLVKNNYEKKIFDKAFDIFFVPQQEKEAQQNSMQQQAEQQQEAQAEAEKKISEELKFKRESVRDDLEDEEVELELTEEQKKVYTKLDPEIQQKIQDYIEQSFPGHLRHSPNTKSALENMIGGKLNYWQRQLEKENGVEQEEKSIDSQLTGDLEMDRVIEQVVSSLQQEKEELINKDLNTIPEEELPQVTMLVKELSHRLATKISRRFQRNKKTGQIDLRKTIRSNIKYGGTMFDLKYQEKKVQKPKFLLICDVSDSMARYATFVLQFVYGISSVIRDIESFIFSEDLERVTEHFTQTDSFGDTIVNIINSSQEWGQTTDLRTSLETFEEEYLDLLTPQTILIIMSDTKTIRLYDAADKLAEIKKQAKEVIWLNTLPKSEWKNLKSVETFKEVSRMVECYTIKHLQNFLNEDLF